MAIGLESELNLAMPKANPQVRKQLLLAMLKHVKDIVPAIANAEGPVTLPGLMTGNGSRIYLDAGDLLEIATPEVLDPWDAVASLRANELIALEALAKAARTLNVDPAGLRLIRCASSYDGHYRGIHLNVMTRNENAQVLIEHLTPFLVTRYYACAGGFGPAGFVMSHKHSAVKTAVSIDARQNRGIVNLKDESLSGAGSHRIHITHGDLSMSLAATYLASGCTALVIAMLDDGVCVGPAYKLQDPVAALRQLDTDYAWSSLLPLASGGVRDCLEIQEHYLQAAEHYAKLKHLEWMDEVVEFWRRSLEAFKTIGPLGVARTIDACIKLKLYSAYLRRQGTSLEEFSRWCPPLVTAAKYLPAPTPHGAREFLRDRMPAVEFELLNDRMRRQQLAWADLSKAAALHARMLLLDLQYHDISPNGLFSRLCRDGMVSSIFTDDRVPLLKRQPPPGTRAEARARAIVEVATDPSAHGNWQMVSTQTRRAVFNDPCTTRLTWAPNEPKRKGLP